VAAAVKVLPVIWLVSCSVAVVVCGWGVLVFCGGHLSVAGSSCAESKNGSPTLAAACRHACSWVAVTVVCRGRSRQGARVLGWAQAMDMGLLEGVEGFDTGASLGCWAQTGIASLRHA